METPFDDIYGNVFESVEVIYTPRLQTVISWRLKASVPPGPGLFVVQQSRWNEPWINVAGPVDDNQATVNAFHIASPDQEVVKWRVVYMINGKEYPSDIIIGHFKASKKDLGLLNTIAHRECLTFDRYSGTPGLLLKARTSGVPCPLCTDYGIETSSRSSCPNCYGTGHAGGFYQGKPWKMMFGGAPNTTKTAHPTLGSIEAKNAVVVRALNENAVEPGDPWIDSVTQERWKFGEIQPEIVFKGFVITLKMTMSRLQFSEAHPLNNPDTSEKLQEPEKKTEGGLWETL